MLQRVRGTEDVQAEHDDLIKASEMSKTIGNPYRKIPETKYRPHFFMAIAIPFFRPASYRYQRSQLLCSCDLPDYGPGLGESASLMSTVVTGVVGICGTFVSILTVDKFGVEEFCLWLGEYEC